MLNDDPRTAASGGRSAPTPVLRIERWLLPAALGAVLLGSVGWGLPSAERVDALLAGEAPTARQRELLTTLRQEFYRSSDRDRSSTVW